MIGNFIGNSYKKRFMKSTVCKALKMICLWTLTPSFQGSNPCSAVKASVEIPKPFLFPKFILHRIYYLLNSSSGTIPMEM